MKHFYLILITITTLLLAACGASNDQSQTQTDSVELNDTIQVKPVVVERVASTPDMAVFGMIQYGKVKSITTDDILAETPVMEFNEQGEMVPTKPMEVIIRDQQGRPVVHNGGKMAKDSTGFVFHHTYTYNGESMQVASIYAENTTDMKMLVNFKRFTYAGDNISPSSMCEIQQTATQPSANYYTYSYITIDEQGNWTEREVKNYSFAHPDFFSPELMSQLKDETATQAAEAQLIEHLDEATATTYTEYRTLAY